MKPLFFVCFLVIAILPAKSQNTTRITVKADSSLSKFLTFKERYSYPTFINGTVFFKDGAAYNAVLNYNLFTGQMQFINSRGDTLELANENTIKVVAITRDSFYYDKGYYRLLLGYPEVKLAVQQRLTIVDNQKIGAFGQPTTGAGVETVDRIVQTNKLTIMENTILAKESKYYLGNKFNQFVPFNKKGLMKMFSNHQNNIRKYLDETSIDFNKQQDLIRTLGFLQNLST